MADPKIFAGPRVRRIRTKLDMTQTAMAGALEISPSYLNLIERNQRPLTAQLVMKLMATFDLDIRELQGDGEGGSVAALKEVFTDPLLSGELPGDTELMEVSEGAPNAALAVVKLYRAYREQQNRLTDLSRLMRGEGHAVAGGEQTLPLEQVRQKLEALPWCFPALERAAERINEALQSHSGRMAALYSLLRADHGVSVQVLPVETMPVWRRRFDRHSRRLFLSERLPRWERAELLAQELVHWREAEVLDEEVSLLGIDGDEAIRLARRELARYTALAVLMPYDRFQRTAERVKTDLGLLTTRFEASFAQVAERLVSLQDKSGGRRASQPFFMMQVDQAGNVLRRLGARGFPAARFGGNCPKLALHAAFERAGELLTERVMTMEGDVYLTMSSTVDGPQTATNARPIRTAVLLGIEDTYAKTIMAAKSGRDGEGTPRKGTVIVEQDDQHARTIAHARLLPDLEKQPPVAIGPSCRLCEREDCLARSAPPLTRPLGLDELTQGFGAYGLS
ncbi:MAG: short-chain fatty acyl-CoA regulator family protein [Pseudomonadota bacterium]